MLDHVTIRVKDIEKTLLFYSRALAPLGYEVSFDKKFGLTRVVGFGTKDKTDTWFTSDTPISGPLHIAWKTDSDSMVDSFFREAIAAGGVDNGKPGERPHYQEHYYAAYVIDPDGNNVEVVNRFSINKTL